MNDEGPWELIPTGWKLLSFTSPSLLEENTTYLFLGGGGKVPQPVHAGQEPSAVSLPRNYSYLFL